MSSESLERLVDFLTGKTVRVPFFKQVTIDNVTAFSGLCTAKSGFDEIVDINDVHGFESFMQKYSMLNEWYEARQPSTKPTVKGLKVCITGDFSNLRERVCEFLKSQGVVIQGHVSKDLDFLLVGEGSGKNAKVSKANEYGTTRGGIDKFLDTYGLHKEWDDFKPTVKPNKKDIEELAKQVHQIYLDSHDVEYLEGHWSELHKFAKDRFRAIAKHFATPSSTLQTALTESLESERELMGYLREIGKIFGKNVGTDIGVQDVVDLVKERNHVHKMMNNCVFGAKSVDKLTVQEVAELFMKLTDTTLFMKGKEWGLINNGNNEEIASLKLNDDDLNRSRIKCVLDEMSFFRNIGCMTPDEQREELRKSMVKDAQWGKDLNSYLIGSKFEQYNQYMIPGKDDVSLEYTPVAPASHVVQTIRDTVNTDDVKSSFVLEKWSNGEITVNNQNIGEWLVDCYEPITVNKVIEAVRNLK